MPVGTSEGKQYEDEIAFILDRISTARQSNNIVDIRGHEDDYDPWDYGTVSSEMSRQVGVEDIETASKRIREEEQVKAEALLERLTEMASYPTNKQLSKKAHDAFWKRK